MALYKFGKKPAVHDPRTLKFAAYLKPSLPPAPDAYSSLDRIATNLNLPDATPLFPLDGNDTKGDCTICGAAHLVTNWRGLIGLNYVPPENDVVTKYFEMTGGEDSGLVLLDVLKYWRKYGLFGDTIGGFVKVDHNNIEHIKLAIYLFGGVYTGFIVQQNAIQDFENGIPWTAGPPDPEGGGHCISGMAYRNGLFRFATWGAFQDADESFLKSCVDEMYAVIPPEASSEKFDPGFDLATLQKDIYAIAA